MKILILSILLFVAVVLSDTTIQYSSSKNVTVSNAGKFSFRSTGVFVESIQGLGSVAGYYSTEFDATTTNTSGYASGDLIAGLIKFVPTQVPGTFMAYIKASGSAKIGTDGTTLSKFDYTAAGGFILTAYVRLDEKDTSGNVVRSIKLKDLLWSTQNGSNNGLHYVTVSASNIFILKGGESIQLSFLISEKLGIVDFGSVSTPVTPKTLESVVQISGYNYATSTNTLTLVTGVVTGSAGATFDGVSTVATGSGDSKVYAIYSNDVDISGKPGKVTIKTTATAQFTDISDDAVSQAVVKGVYSAGIQAKIIEVTFPAGAPNIIYDPSCGAGEPLGASGVTLIVSIIGLLVALLI